MNRRLTALLLVFLLCCSTAWAEFSAGEPTVIEVEESVLLTDDGSEIVLEP